MSDRNRDEASRMASPQGSGSDTLSAAAMGSGATGNAGQPQNSPYQSSGPDRSGRSSGAQGQQGAGSTSGGMSEMARNAAETVRQTTGDLRERTGETVEQASQWAREQYDEGARQRPDVLPRAARDHWPRR